MTSPKKDGKVKAEITVLQELCEAKSQRNWSFLFLSVIYHKARAQTVSRLSSLIIVFCK